ncbi:DUF5074 domain-containing protein [Salisaeta longa]|uniref:DUF5074 domain-containing protein n=1 Tax=Salisaeta longa TaxID=503170 RepID=UPI0003B32431|nr:DUF5074 domain-containing protein [Salisaeta longa]
MRTVLHRLLVLFLLAGLSGCDLLGTEDDAPPAPARVVVANAGAFGNQNSSLTFYNPTSDATERLPAQDGFASYIQSLARYEERLYVAFGETGTVDIFNAETNSRVGQLSGIPNPRYVAFSGNQAFITSQDYASNPQPAVYVANLDTRQIVDTIPVSGSPERMALVGDRLYVAEGNQNGTLAVIDATNRTVMDDAVPVGCDVPRALVHDGDGELLVFCAGATIYNENFEVVDRTNGAIHVLDPSTNTITTEISLDGQLTSASLGQRVWHSPSADVVHTVVGGNTIVRFNTATNTIAARIPDDGAPIGTLAYDAAVERLYVGRLAAENGFASAGTVTLHRPDGTQTGSFPAGIAPADVVLQRSTP